MNILLSNNNKVILNSVYSEKATKEVVNTLVIFEALVKNIN